MGLDYSMISYVPEKNFGKALKWLEKNSYGHNKPPRQISIGEDILSIKTDFLYINGNHISEEEELKYETQLESIGMSLSLVFEVDSAIIKMWEGGYSYGQTPNKFDEYLLPNNQIWVGAFDSGAKKIEKYQLYRFEFQAVTSDMSLMLKDSYSIKNWFLEFSKECSSLISLFDFEGEERFLYFNGRNIKFETKSLLNQNDKNIPQNMINEFYKYESELYPDYSFCSERLDPIHGRINIIEGEYYNFYVLGRKWFIEIISQGFDNAINFRELNNIEINRFRKEGKIYSDYLANKYYQLLNEYWRNNLHEKKGLIDLDGDKMWYTKIREKKKTDENKV